MQRMAWIHIQQAIRDFFKNEGFLDVLTPPVVTNPGMETHLHPFELKSKVNNKDLNLYLHTSPEFHMKQLLSEGLEKIFTMSYSFRDEPNSTTHRPQFIMLEWYRSGEHYEKIMDDAIKLFSFCHDYLKQKKISLKPELETFNVTKMTVQEIFDEVLNIDILEYLEAEKLRSLIVNEFKDVPVPDCDLSWDDLYFLLFLNKVEPQLEKYPFLLLYEFPYHLSALSTLKKDDLRVCERFEVYSFGVELCNCFNELTDLKTQKERFQKQAKDKKNLYQYELPNPCVLYNSLEKGLPKSSGIALGVERLLMTLTGLPNPFWD